MVAPAALLAAILLAAPLAGADTQEADAGIYDPWEGYNRKIFAFNESLSRNVAEPVARAWDFTVPDFARIGLRNFFVNLAFPIRVVNTTLQLKPLATFHEITRFVFNSSFGAGGLLDVATHGLLIPIHKEDFGQTLGYWGVPPGPYFMLPVFGPSTVRGTVGLAGDVAVSAATFNLIGISVPFFATFAAQAGNFINSQSFVHDDIDRERKNALDFYVSVRNAYLQFRRNMIRDGALEAHPVEADEDLYYPEAEDEPPAPQPGEAD